LRLGADAVIASLAVLLVYQLAGEVIVLALGLPVPGPVVGMVLLLLTLLARRGASAGLEAAANGLLFHLSLLFVPAGVGVMLHWERLAAQGVGLVLALVASTLLTLAVCALTMQALMRRRGAGR
jgi:holin-like protein